MTGVATRSASATTWTTKLCASGTYFEDARALLLAQEGVAEGCGDIILTHTKQAKDAQAATLLQVLQKHYPETLKEKIMPPDLVAVANAAAEEARKKQEEEEGGRREAEERLAGVERERDEYWETKQRACEKLERMEDVNEGLKQKEAAAEKKVAEAEKKVAEAEELKQELQPTEGEREALEDEVADLRAKAARPDFDTDELRDLAEKVGQDEDGRLSGWASL